MDAATTWHDLLDDFEDLIEQISYAVDFDEFEGRSFPSLVKTVPDGTPTGEQLARLAALLAEADSLQNAVRSCQATVKIGLDQLQRESRAGRAYLGSTA